MFDAYYAGPECGDQYAKTPQSVTFKCLGKTHLYAAAVTADTPDDAYDQLRQGTPDALERSYRYAPKRPMGAGDALLQGDDPEVMLVRTRDGCPSATSPPDARSSAPEPARGGAPGRKPPAGARGGHEHPVA